MTYRINLRWFNKDDIDKKVEWINNHKVNKFLHYNLPLDKDRTLNWYNNIIDDSKRCDFTIEIIEKNKKKSVGLIGLLDIDRINNKAEFYITIGETEYWGKGIALKASKKFLDYSFKKYNLNKIYLYTEKDNIAAQNLFEKIGFSKEGLLKDDLIYMGDKIDRYYYGLLKKDFYNDEKT